MPGTQQPYFIIDFDSTFTQVEALEELAAISLKNDPDKERIIEKIRQLTDLTMEGKMPFSTSLKARIALLAAKKYHIGMLVNSLRKKVSVSMARNKKFFREYQGRVLIVSGGFKEFIIPVVKAYHIDESCVFANTFTYDAKNNITGAEGKNPLAQEQGKVKLLKQLRLSGELIAIGDGYTDLELYKAKAVSQFYAFTENISRETVVKNAPKKAASLDEILFERQLPMSISFPKSKIIALLAGKETYAAEPYLKAEGYRVIKQDQPDLSQLKEASLAIMGTGVNLSALRAQDLNKLLCVGLWNHHQAPGKRLSNAGVVVFGSPFSESRSEAELVLSYLLNQARRNEFELKGKRVGIAGYLHAGSTLSLMLEALGMDVFYSDTMDPPPLGKATKVKHLAELFRKSDAVIITSDFEGEVATTDLKQIKKQGLLISMRPFAAEQLKAIQGMLASKKLAGFAMDNDDTQVVKGFEKTQAQVTSGSRTNTKEARELKAQSLSESLIRFINTGNTVHSMNFPEIQLPEPKQSHRFIHIHRNKPGVLAKINGVLARNQLNITGQYLKTNDETGFVITDVGREYERKVIEELKTIPETIRFRVLY